MAFIMFALHALHLVSAVLLVALVLLHAPKSDGIGSIGTSAQLFSSQKGAEAALNKITATVAGAFFLLSFVLGYYFNG